jgi:hypothetical protein
MAFTAMSAFRFQSSLPALSPGRASVMSQEPDGSRPCSMTWGTGVNRAAHSNLSASIARSIPLEMGAHFRNWRLPPSPTSNVRPARGVRPTPAEQTLISRSVRRFCDVACDSTGPDVDDREVDGVAIGVSPDDVVVVICQYVHCGCPPVRSAIVVGIDLGEGHLSRQHCERSHPRADKLLIKPRRVGQVGAGNTRNGSNARHTQRWPVFSRVTLVLPAPAWRNHAVRPSYTLTVFSFVPRCQGECGSQK